MPHSGGGGSHSGGHSSSSHHSSGGSHSGGGSGSSVRVSSTPFTGGQPYAVYKKGSGSRLVYVNSPVYTEETGKLSVIATGIFSSFFFIPGVIALIAAIIGILASITIGFSKTDYKRADDRIIIADRYDHVTDEEEARLKDALENFRDETGIIPAVEFTEDKEWVNDYTDMESFAYNEYIVKFNDEYHLLIIYSYGYENAATGFNEFQWHTMWGDDLGKTASENDENSLGENLQKEFARANGQDVPSAVINAVNTFKDHLLGKKIAIDWEKAGPSFFFILWGAGFTVGGMIPFLSVLKRYRNDKAEGKKTVKIKGEPVPITCDYCGGIYYKGTVIDCPHCGAPVRAEEVH